MSELCSLPRRGLAPVEFTATSPAYTEIVVATATARVVMKVVDTSVKSVLAVAGRGRAGHGLAVDWWSLGMLVFEMLTGLPPWYTPDRFKLFSSICEAQVVFPFALSKPAEGVIRGLLTRSPEERLGSKGDGSQVQRHSFFDDVVWEDLLAQRTAAPFQPQIDDHLSTMYFDPSVTGKTVESHFASDAEGNAAAEGALDAAMKPGVFSGFKYARQGSVREQVRRGSGYDIVSDAGTRR